MKRFKVYPSVMATKKINCGRPAVDIVRPSEWNADVSEPVLGRDFVDVTNYVWENTDSKSLIYELNSDNGSIYANDTFWYITRNNFTRRTLLIIADEMRRLFPQLKQMD